MPKRLLVTGGGGLVGSAIKYISDAYPQYDLFFTTHKEHDLTQESVVKDLFERVKPDYVIHTAAFVGGIGRNLASPAQQYYQNILMNSFVIHHAMANSICENFKFPHNSLIVDIGSNVGAPLGGVILNAVTSKNSYGPYYYYQYYHYYGREVSVTRYNSA